MTGAAVVRDRVREVIAPIVATSGLDLEEVSVAVAGRRQLIRVVVDGDGGVGLDAVAEVSRAVADALDESEALGESAYVLEVTSPGVDRPLQEPRHWRRSVGRLVAVTAAGRRVTGRLVAADDDAATLEVAGHSVRHPYADLGPGAVQVEFTRGDGHEDADGAE